MTRGGKLNLVNDFLPAQSADTMPHFAHILFGLTGLLYFYGGCFLPSWRRGPRTVRLAHAGSMAALFALNVTLALDTVAHASNSALFAFAAQALGLLGCCRVLASPIDPPSDPA